MLKIINALIEIGLNADDMHIITELMFANRIKKFHHFFNNIGTVNTVKTTKLALPFSNEQVEVYEAHIGDKYLSKPVEMFFKFLFSIYNFKYFDFRQIETLLHNQTLNDIYTFSQLVSRCKRTDLCKIVYKKIDTDLFFQNYFNNANMQMNNYNVPVQAF